MNQVTCNKSVGRCLCLASIILSVVATSQVFAADEVTGDWDIATRYGSRDSFTKLSVSKKAEGTLAGTWGDDELSEFKFQDGKLSFVRVVRRGDQEFRMSYAGTLQGGKLVGTVTTNWGEFPATGTRMKPMPAALGTWDISYSIGERDIKGRLTISENADGALRGKWSGERGEHSIANVKCEDGKLSFSRTSKFGEREFKSTYEGTVKGHKLTGKFTSQRGEIEANGERFGAELVGKWELTTTSDRGTRTSTLTVYPDMTARYRLFGGAMAVDELTLEGDQVMFRMEAGFGDRTFEMKFNGKLDGKTLNGQLVTSRGTSDVTGKKIDTASALVGKWEFTRESSRGTRTNTLTIKEDMTGTYTVRDSEVDVT
ncbi:MAG: hypothetical protein JSU70_16345, partial [Phycisphaerales bacterium]